VEGFREEDCHLTACVGVARAIVAALTRVFEVPSGVVATMSLTVPADRAGDVVVGSHYRTTEVRFRRFRMDGAGSISTAG
jgi:hypothetical protein